MKLTKVELYKAIKVIQRAKIVSDKNIMEMNALTEERFAKRSKAVQEKRK